ncbi:MAG TPA: hypothetical protein VMV23_02610 [Candidatus Nanopelagicaceae bacterium]|nr:hypothetical protein [Candidatus Nanopelagicaceae bacterium]
MTENLDQAHIRVTWAGHSRALTLPWETTIEAVGQMAAKALDITPEAGLEWWCADGTSLANKLERTLGDFKERKICPKLEFEFRSPHPG